MKNFIGILFFILLSLPAPMRGELRFNNATDTVKVMTLLREFNEPGGDPSTKMGDIAERLLDIKYGEVIKGDSIGIPEIILEELDEMTFLNMAAAIARMSTSPGHHRIEEFAEELENISCRKGKYTGPGSKMLYASDWVLDNKARKNIKELTETYSDSFKTKSLDKITRHREEYTMLKDSANYEAQRMVEMGFRTHKIPHMRRESSTWKEVLTEMQDGDIIMLLSPESTTDVYEIGIVRERPDGFHLIHPSKKEGKVTEEKETLGRYIKRHSKDVYGYRWIRLSK